MDPVTPRHAASLLVFRADADGPKLLMARRGAGHRFMPHMLVFPGGSVDTADFLAPVASDLRPEVSARLERSAPPELARALAVAAARELTEEVGLSLGVPPPLHGLDYLCRAVTPPDMAMRFDARFFVVSADAVTGTPAPSTELEAPAWYGVEAALTAGCSFATKLVLLQFQKWFSARPEPAAPVPVLQDRAWMEE